jgi:hypothetical protein
MSTGTTGKQAATGRGPQSAPRGESLRGLARLLRVNERAVRRARDRGRLPAHLFAADGTVFDVAGAVRAWTENRKGLSPAERNGLAAAQSAETGDAAPGSVYGDGPRLPYGLRDLSVHRGDDVTVAFCPDGREDAPAAFLVDFSPAVARALGQALVRKAAQRVTDAEFEELAAARTLPRRGRSHQQPPTDPRTP